ncbi:MAG: hypothetical protein ACTHL7_00930 [Steroidobacteraceae bacterium]
MRVAVFSALALLAAAASSAAPSLHRAHSVCATQADKTAMAAHSKASSFAPHPGSGSHVYGIPIQSRILKSRPKKNTQIKDPQLKSAPLPDATSANGPSSRP